MLSKLPKKEEMWMRLLDFKLLVIKKQRKLSMQQSKLLMIFNKQKMLQKNKETQKIKKHKVKPKQLSQQKKKDYKRKLIKTKLLNTEKFSKESKLKRKRRKKLQSMLLHLKRFKMKRRSKLRLPSIEKLSYKFRKRKLKISNYDQLEVTKLLLKN